MEHNPSEANSHSVKKFANLL